MYFYNSQGDWAGGVEIQFYSAPKYDLSWCSSSWTNFPSTLPTAVDKVWRISLTRTADKRLQIHCNNVEVLNFLLTDVTCDDSDWYDYWSRDVEKIVFRKYDTASEDYRLHQQGESDVINLIMIKYLQIRYQSSFIRNCIVIGVGELGIDHYHDTLEYGICPFVIG